MSNITRDTFHMIFGPAVSPVSQTNYTKDHDIASLLTLVRYFRPKRFLEIGINVGYTAKNILDMAPWIERYVGVDVTIDYVPPIAGQRGEITGTPGKLVLDDKRVELLVKPHGSVDVTAVEIGVMDMVFIDGDHSYGGVAYDTDLARSVIRPGGVILWHDYGFPGLDGLRKYIDEQNCIKEGICLVQGTTLCFQVVGHEG